MAQGMVKIVLAFLCLYGFINAEPEPYRFGDPPLGPDKLPIKATSDIQFDQEPPYPYSGDGKTIDEGALLIDDEDYGVSGSGSGSGGGMYDLDGVDGDSKVDATTSTSTTTSTTTTTTTEIPFQDLSPCQQDRKNSQRFLTSYVPQCLSNGDYKALQCHGHPSTSDCFCVDLAGRPIPGTHMERPNFPSCEEGYNLPKCTHQLVKSTRSKLLGAWRPKCTTDGHFNSTQCHGSVCYCVDRYNGEQVPGTQTTLPKFPLCEGDGLERTTKPLRPVLKRPAEKIPYDGMDGDVGFEEASETIDVDQDSDEELASRSDDDGFHILPGNKFGEKVSEGGQDVEGEDTSDQSSEEEVGQGGEQDSSHGQKDRVEKASEILTQPGILAGIIGGGVVLLLCLVLLIMFVVYRMRKKDEGSYPLDEPRRGPPNYSYVRAPDKEYYA